MNNTPSCYISKVEFQLHEKAYGANYSNYDSKEGGGEVEFSGDGENVQQAILQACSTLKSNSPFLFDVIVKNESFVEQVAEILDEIYLYDRIKNAYVSVTFEPVRKRDSKRNIARNFLASLMK